MRYKISLELCSTVSFLLSKRAQNLLNTPMNCVPDTIKPILLILLLPASFQVCRPIFLGFRGFGNLRKKTLHMLREEGDTSWDYCFLIPFALVLTVDKKAI